MSTRDRLGKITLPDGTVYRLRLSSRPSVAYRPTYVPVWPEFRDIPGAEGKVSGDPQIRTWHISEFSGGEGNDLWKRDEPAKWHQASNVRLKTTGEGLVLGARSTVTQDAGASTFVDGERLGIAMGTLWAVQDNTAHQWDDTNVNWNTAGWATGAAGSDATSIVDFGDGSNLLIGLQDNSIRKVASGANSTLYAAAAADPFTYDPVLKNWGGTMYALDGDDLYTIDTTTTDTRTKVSDLSGRSNVYLTTNPKHTYSRLSSSDVGPVWYQVLDNGQTFVWEYNEADATTTRTGKLLVDQATPYSIFWANGFTFVAFRYAMTHSQAGDAYVYYQRGAQKGVVGPFRSSTGTTAARVVQLCGIIGNDLVVFFDGVVWAYNLTSGGIYPLAVSDTSNSNNVYDGITWGSLVFLANHDNQAEVELLRTKQYSTTSATWESGRYDYGYEGTKKVLLDVTVVTEPLPTNTTITCAVAANGGSYSALTGTFTGDGSTTKYTWTASDGDASITGEDFEIRLTLTTTTVTSTPTIRSVSSRVTAGSKQRAWDLLLEAGDPAGGVEATSPSWQILADVRAIAEHAGVVTFSNPWDVSEFTDPVDYTVVVEDVALVEVRNDRAPVVQMRLRDTAYV